ncbi:Uu.00g020240.m01.CDS01 [Anthostomella pinea]|uniref:Uu.00g020240.m01.CDS01 n=1 Tax=Anthostomella pinea TaxID=933095 RepID=A0AAI8W0C8_9PEZI|nr:Uu.00g020240.m01.CDS01 [Anthostomella pinea]
MDRLPQEIYDEIGALLHDPAFCRPALATVSRQWQIAIERQTFRNIRLRSTDLGCFQQIVQHRRRRYVNAINYLIVLPGYSDEKRRQFEREDDRRANDEVFTTVVHRLFHRLEHWDVSKDGFIKFCLRDVYSSADHAFLRRSSPS